MKVKIGYNVFTVRAMTEEERTTWDAWGLFDPLAQEILIYPEVSPAEQARILIHEITHGLYDLLQPPHKALEEEVCSFMDRGLSTVFTDNAWIMGTIHQALSNGVAIV